MRFLERTIESFSPQLALNRELARKRLSVARSFEAASLGKRLEAWGSQKAKEQPFDRKILRNRARFIVENNPYASAAVDILSVYLIGNGIIPHILKSDSENKFFEKILKDWADKTECDADKRLNFYGLETVVMNHVITDGEVFIQRIFTRSNSKLPIRLKVIECDYLDETKNQDSKPGLNRISKGIEYNSLGERVAYWFYDQHPEQHSSYRLESKRILAEDVIHIYRKRWASQERGLTWFLPIIVKLKDFDDYEDAELMRQKLSACIFAILRDLEAQGDDFDKKDSFPRNIEPGAILTAPSGQTMDFHAPPSPLGTNDWLVHSKMTMGVGVRIPYMLLSGDYSAANYSSSRMAMVNFYKFISQVQNITIIPQLCQPISNWFIEALSLTKQTGNIELSWSLPKKELTDPIKDVESTKLSVEAGFMAHSDAIRELGDDPADVYERIKDSNDKADKLGLKFSTDYRNETKENIDAKSIAI